MAKLNSTAPIASRGYDAGERHTVSTRKIENGWLVDEDTCNYGTGEYKTRTTFSKAKPEVQLAKVKGDSGGIINALADTKTYLRGK